MSWPMVKLHDICRPKQWKTIAASSLIESGYPVYGANGKIGFYSKFTHEFPTLMITCRGATCGNVHISEPMAYINGNAMALDDIDRSKVDIKYLYYFFLKRGFDDVISGSAQPQITGQGLTKVEIPLPPLLEQKRIAAILDKANDIRQKREQAMKLANDFLRTTFLNMFGDPVENPKKLKTAPITELADVITGFAFKSNEYISDTSESVRLCRGANTLTGYLDWADTKFWPKNKIEKLDNYLIKAGDIILAMDRPWISSGLKVCIFPENQRETYLVQRVARLRPRCESYTNYIYSCIKSPAFEKHCRPTETTVPHISPVELKNFEVLIPNSELMDKYHSIASTINNILNKMDTCNISGDALFSKLCQQAFSGHLKR
ncbi:restriction endonuclease subunit S [Citrobacter cronae]|uniref:restriction endonuclease subunit S n=1 Tax=Citrobacter freundii complex TaxID=1344959 RepID=UPI000A118D17|nr:restriction endonuclease subunit S [Citrobacter werkmanii]MBS6075269.1 restriction endonuclease subunit S [Citrobacter freundii]ORT75542.1 hypothetical protein BO998_10165 [Citrobacter werkmanii]OSP19946.1 hypothetical protein B6S66_06140 [Citrobacter werkmanii]